MTADNEKPRVFIGCTIEGKNVALAFQSNMETWCFPEIWDHGISRPSLTTIESLENVLPAFDLAVFILTADDVSVVRGKRHRTPRDNLIFELGLATGLLGRHRTFIVVPRSVPEVKLPSDLDSVIRATYDPQAPNVRAATSSASTLIRDHAPGRAASIRDTPRRALHRALSQLHQRHNADLAPVLSAALNVVVRKGILRRNWNINISYSFPPSSPSIIEERIAWSYEFVNITRDPVDYPLTLVTAAGSTSRLVYFSRLNDAGHHAPVFDPPAAHAETNNYFVRQTRTLTLPPGEWHALSLEYVYQHPVSPDAHHVHNALASVEPALNARIRVDVPPGYRFDILCGDVVKPTVFRGTWEFYLPGPLLPFQLVEYVFQRHSNNNATLEDTAQ